MTTRADRRRGTERVRWALGACLALVMISTVKADREFPDAYFFDVDLPEVRARHDAMTGKPRPEFSVTDWKNADLSSEDLKGKILVIDLWATWCGPCLRAVPENNELAESYADQGVLVLGVCTSSGQERMDEVVQEYQIQYPVARDPEQTTAEAWNVGYYPTYAVVDRKGILRAIGLMPSHIEDVVQAILKEQPAPSDADAGKADAGEGQ